MNAERIFKIVMTDFSCERLKLEEDLERVVNSKLESEVKTQEIKSIVNRIVMVDASLAHFSTMINNNNTNKNETENGKV
jgi:3-methyladenine DNA glycosylase/8-oxoguanine DNA glycosylase